MKGKFFKSIIHNINIFLRRSYRPSFVFSSSAYQRHNQKRLDHLSSLGLNIAGSSVLEVGAGIGDHTSFFLDLGCQVVTSDARDENIKILRARYPQLEVFHLDLDNPPSTFTRSFDIVYCYGTLYHTKDPAAAIKYMSRRCKKMLLLETCVSFGNEDSPHFCAEDIRNPSQSRSGVGCRPTRRWVYNQLKKYFHFVYLPITQPDHEEFPLDWTHPLESKGALTRAIYVASKEKLKNKMLMDDVLMNQMPMEQKESEKNNEYLALLNKAVLLSGGSRFRQLRNIPKRMLFSKMIEFAFLFLKRSYKARVKTFWHDDMIVVMPEMVSLNIYRYGYIEEGLTRMVLDKLKGGMTFFDIGAHYGYFTLLASAIVGDNGHVHSFEPTPTTFKILKKNISCKTNIVLNQCAVFSDKKTIHLNDYGTKYAAFNSLFTPRLAHDGLANLKTSTYPVNCITVDDYVESNHVLPDFIKIDAESAEYQILQGMLNTIKICKPIISIEVGDLAEGVLLSKNAIDFLRNNNYQPYEYEDGSIKVHTVRGGPYPYGNLLFLPV